MMSCDLEVILVEALTGRISVRNCRQSGTLSDVAGKWTLLVSGEKISGGKFLPGNIAPGESREFLLSVEIPPVSPEEKPFLQIIFTGRDDEKELCSAIFPLPVICCKVSAEKKYPFTTGIRADASEAMISAGKLSAVITSGGMRELRYKGDHLLSDPPRSALWQYGCDTDPRIAALALDRMRISPDRFTSGESAVECHALALPRRMDLDELEITQRFIPAGNESIRWEIEFIVPESFAGIPRLGMAFSLVRELTASAVIPAPGAAEFAAFTGNDGSGLLITAAGYPVRVSVLPYDEYALLGNSLPAGDGRQHITIDCRNCQDVFIGAGRFKLILILAYLNAGEDPAEKARRLKFSM